MRTVFLMVVVIIVCFLKNVIRYSLYAKNFICIIAAFLIIRYLQFITKQPIERAIRAELIWKNGENLTMISGSNLRHNLSAWC